MHTKRGLFEVLKNCKSQAFRCCERLYLDSVISNIFFTMLLITVLGSNAKRCDRMLKTSDYFKIQYAYHTYIWFYVFFHYAVVAFII